MSKKRIITMVKKMADENMKVAVNRDEFVNYSMDLVEQTRRQDAKLFFAAYMMTLRDEYGFGEKRLRNIHDKSVELVGLYAENPSLWKKDVAELYSIGLKLTCFNEEEETKNV